MAEAIPLRGAMWFGGNGGASREPDFARLRAAMVDQQLRRRGIRDQRVLEAMLVLPRHEFIAPAFRLHSYEDRPIPIGAGQTISQPYMVAVMTEELALRETDKVLEIGTGSGYQTALLAMLAARICTVEREHDLVQDAQNNLKRLAEAGLVDLGRIEFIEGDGSEGYAPGAPFDAILVAAAAPAVPHSLQQQLAEGGRLVIPVGTLSCQELRQIRKVAGQLVARTVNECRFVPLLGKEGWRE